jgi:hypothetical protein
MQAHARSLPPSSPLTNCRTCSCSSPRDLASRPSHRWPKHTDEKTSKWFAYKCITHFVQSLVATQAHSTDTGEKVDRLQLHPKIHYPAPAVQVVLVHFISRLVGHAAGGSPQLQSLALCPPGPAPLIRCYYCITGHRQMNLLVERSNRMSYALIDPLLVPVLVLKRC